MEWGGVISQPDPNAGPGGRHGWGASGFGLVGLWSTDDWWVATMVELASYLSGCFIVIYMSTICRGLTVDACRTV